MAKIRSSICLFWISIAIVTGIAGCGRTDPNSSLRRPSQELEGSSFFYEHFDESQQTVYRTFSKAAEKPFSEEPIQFVQKNDSDTENTFVVTKENLDVIYQGFRYDHPEWFWIGNSYQYRRLPNESGDYDENRIDAVATVPLFATESEWEQARQVFSERTGQIFDEIDRRLKARSIREKDADYTPTVVRVVHDFLLETIIYEENATYDPSLWKEHTAYGALVDGKAVCDGYALAFRYLLSGYGIDCILIPGEFCGTAHVWTEVWYDGDWHEIDPTMDDVEEEELRYRYYDLTTDEMNKDHTRENSEIAGLLPVTSS